MGYYTNYTIKVLSLPVGMEGDFLTKLTNCIDYEFVEEDGVYKSDDRVKWYDCEKDLIKLTQSNPGLELFVHGVGEENGDIWCAFAYDGRFDRRHVVMQLNRALPSDLSAKYVGASGLIQQINNIE